MSTRLRIPTSAIVVDTFGGTIPVGPYKGGHCSYVLYAGLASKGYRSGYERIPTRWLECIVRPGNGEKAMRHAWSYSGKRYADAQADFLKNRDDFLAACRPAADVPALATIRQVRAVPASGQPGDSACTVVG